MLRSMTIRLFGLVLLLAAVPGCLAERSFPMNESRLVRREGKEVSTREWAAEMHQRAEHLLPDDKRGGLTTAQLATPLATTTVTLDWEVVFGLMEARGTMPAEELQRMRAMHETIRAYAAASPPPAPPKPPAPAPRDVWGYFRLDPKKLDSLFDNYAGIEHTAQVTSPTPEEREGHIFRPGWKDFEYLEVPVGDGITLYGRLAVPEKSREIPGSFIIVTHGLFGSIDGYDMMNHVMALRRAGHHVLALEMRGHGETNCRHPEYVISFGIYECGDLLAAARWLKTARGANRVGLVCFSLTAYEALLTAWLDGKEQVTDLSAVPLLADLPKRQAEAAFNGGIFAISAPVGVVGVADGFDRPVSRLEAPVKGTFQKLVSERLEKYHEKPGFSMWDLARAEFGRSGKHTLYANFDAARQDFMRFMDLSRNDYAVGAARMENVRVPLLVLNSANDPLGSGQSVADLFCRQSNPNIGVILLKHGGHMGFSALSADYYYSLVINFFDPKTGPVAR